MRRSSTASFRLFAVVALLLPALPSAAASATTWSTSGQAILVDGKPFFAKGVTYSPTPIGGSADWGAFQDWFRSGSNYEKVWTRDIPRIREMGANTVKTYAFWGYLPLKGVEWSGAPNNLELDNLGKLDWSPGASAASDHTAFLDALWNDGKDPIHVLIGIAIDAGNTFNNGDQDPTHWGSGPSYTKFYSNTAEWAARKYGSHPAVMGFILGNEMNSPARLRDNVQFWPKLNAMADTVKKHAPGKLVGIAWQGEWPFAVDNGKATYPLLAENMHFDFWGANIYNGKTFGTFWSTWEAFVTANFGKPVLFTEWGMPTGKWDGKSVTESVEVNLQVADDLTSLWNDMVAHSTRCAGGTVFAWSDEWWKVKKEEVSTALPYTHDASRDPKWQEEWWGLNSVAVDKRDPASPTDNYGNLISADVLTQRAGYKALKDLWTKGTYRTPQARLKTGADAPLAGRTRSRVPQSVSGNPLLSTPRHPDGTYSSFIGHRISLNLDPGSYLGTPAEWYLVHVGPSGMRQWDPYAAGWLAVNEVTPLFKAPLESLVDVEIPVGFLSSGANVFTFAVDIEVNGTNDNSHWFSSTNVIVVH